MSICSSGLNAPCCAQPVTIDLTATHPLLQLAQSIPWDALAEMVLPDLKQTTTKGKWWLGRKLMLRIHLGVFLLQWLSNLTDRQIEGGLKEKAAYQLFCGRGVINRWHVPDHTKIEEFRSRLSPDTQRQVANQVAVWARKLGFADPGKRELDSTIQEANLAYPSDAHLMVKMTLLVNKGWLSMKRNISSFTDFLPRVDVKAVKAQARAYGLRDRTDAEQTPRAFEALWDEAFTQISQVRKYFALLLDYDLQRIPWNIRRALAQVNDYCSSFFLHVAGFICRGKVHPEKVLSSHAQAVSCFNKGKVPKRLQFGRAFQLGRMGGNFLVVGACTSLRMEDTASVRLRIGEHHSLFGHGTLHSWGRT